MPASHRRRRRRDVDRHVRARGDRPSLLGPEEAPVHIENRFTVSLPVDDAWKVLLDVEGIAPCMPGAEIEDVIEDGFAGRVKMKMGPIMTEFKGTVSFKELDEEAHRIVLRAVGRETKGQGNASADVTV